MGRLILSTHHCRTVSIRAAVFFSGVELRKGRQQRTDRTGFKRFLKQITYYRLEELYRTYLAESYVGNRLEKFYSRTELAGHGGEAAIMRRGGGSGPDDLEMEEEARGDAQE
jgi:hypothetical protein